MTGVRFDLADRSEPLGARGTDDALFDYWTDASSGDEKKPTPVAPPKAPAASAYGRRTFDDEEDLKVSRSSYTEFAEEQTSDSFALLCIVLYCIVLFCYCYVNQDDWEEEDQEPQAKPALAPPKKKGNLKKKLAEKEAEERRRAELGLNVRFFFSS